VVAAAARRQMKTFREQLEEEIVGSRGGGDDEGWWNYREKGRLRKVKDKGQQTPVAERIPGSYQALRVKVPDTQGPRTVTLVTTRARGPNTQGLRALTLAGLTADILLAKDSTSC
jgi:hypothetical protein